ncbi:MULTISPECIES: class I SAM-dependent methyltransferase [unclassified Streptomyces]|uniref:class I SAM-dependent methyltransferase n=1 Tax=unclassified Streptomyces TaxID=2593676 RepID=UPI003825F780
MTEPSSLDLTRASYDAVAADYAVLLADELADKPYDNAMLAAFAGLVTTGGGGPVGDLGCGPGRVTAVLRDLGLTAFGIDLSPGMIAVARETYPDLDFAVGSMTALDVADDSLAGALAWYSLVHTPPDQLPWCFSEFHRVLAPGGHLLMAFKVGDECVRLERAYGHAVTLDVHRFAPDAVAGMLVKAGFRVQARLVREADEREKTPQAFFLMVKPEAAREPA